MAEYAINSANLSNIENNLHTITRNMNALAQGIDHISGQVSAVYQTVEYVNTEVNKLADEFRTFADEAKRLAALADAKQTVVMLEQELQKEFGYYDTVRKHTVGILQATDISVVRRETISYVTEELMMSAPRYWLAPALIALSAWLSDNRSLAERALKEAMRRDDEKTSLLFCLISRRAGRLNGSVLWLERYFGMQDPERMDRKIIAVLDAYVSGIFGPDAKGVCSEKITAWIDELSSKAGFIEAQRDQWSAALSGKAVFSDDKEFPYLTSNSPTWPQLKEVLSWAKTHGSIQDYLSEIFNTPVDNVASVASQVDAILDNLVNNYDAEELPIRREVRKSKLIIEENGLIDRALLRFDAEAPAYESYESFSQHLTSVALAPESSGALKATQKFIISLSKDWIANAYEDLTAKSRANVPTEIEIKVSDWVGITRDGSNEEELESSLNHYIDDMQGKALSKVCLTMMHWVSLVGGAAVTLLGIIQGSIFFMILGLAGASYWLHAKLTLKRKVDQTKVQIEELRSKAQTALKATTAEVVDYRRLYQEYDNDHSMVMDYINALSPQQCIAVGDRKTRQVLI
jgi:HAMP domain-containing protein